LSGVDVDTGTALAEVVDGEEVAAVTDERGVVAAAPEMVAKEGEVMVASAMADEDEGVADAGKVDKAESVAVVGTVDEDIGLNTLYVTSFTVL
jgi:TusA-related sulfurtransferase